jgi:PKD domain
VIRASLGAALLAALIAASVAQARGHQIAGVVPDFPPGTHSHPAVRAHIAGVSYHGGPVLHWNRTHVIFWQPAGSGLTFDPGYETLIGRFLGDVAADSRKTTNVYGLSGQYHDSAGPAAYNSTYGGAVIATDPLPANGCVEPAVEGPGWSRCLDTQQLAIEVEDVARTQHLPSTGNDIYFLVLPDGLGSCEFGGPTYCALGGATAGSYCGYHAATSSSLLYAVIAYNALAGHCQSGNPRPNASTADSAISTISHEHNEIVTDPFGDGWIDESSSGEIGDLCVTQFGASLGGSDSTPYNEIIHGDRYYLQEEWSNEDGSCQPRELPDEISFRVPARARAHEPVMFVAHASDPHGSIVSYNWYFGDHGSRRGRRASHTFSRPGDYRVVLRTNDSSGNWALDAAEVRVGRGAARDRSARGRRWDRR